MRITTRRGRQYEEDPDMPDQINIMPEQDDPVADIRAYRDAINNSPIHVKGGRPRWYYPGAGYDIELKSPEGLLFLVPEPGQYYLHPGEDILRKIEFKKETPTTNG